MDLRQIFDTVLILLGAGFLVANARLIIEYLSFRRRKAQALLTWPGPRPPDYAVSAALGVVLGLLVVRKVVFVRQQAFGEIMMFLYYGCLLPLSRRIGRGFYADGIWADTSFIPYNEVGGITWQEGEHQITLIVISRLRNLARRLIVPIENYAAARRLLQDKIATRDIHFSGTGLDLLDHDGRDDV